MLHVQKYLIDKTFDDLSKELGILLTYHPTLPLVILNYDQIDSPKTNPIVRECRGLVLHKETLEQVASCMPRFFNWGELTEEMAKFDFNDCFMQSKEDGSLVLIYYFQGKWMANTRSSFGTLTLDSKFTGTDEVLTWHNLFCRAMKINDLQDLDQYLSKDIVYICELCTIWNKGVRTYTTPTMYLLTAFLQTKELNLEEVDKLCPPIMTRPNVYRFKNVEEIKEFIHEKERIDPTYEGLVLRDKNNLRYKFKSATFYSLHHLWENGQLLDKNRIIKRLVPFVLAGDATDILILRPELKESVGKLTDIINNLYATLQELLVKTQNIENQKEFALAVKDHPFKGTLFTLRKENKYNINDLRKAWIDNLDGITNYLERTNGLGR